LAKFYNRAMKWFCCLSVPGAVLFIIWPRLLIDMLLGEKFISAGSVMQWFGIAFMPNVRIVAFPVHLYCTEVAGRVLPGYGTCFVVRVGAELALVPSMGYIGACVVAVFSEIGAFAILIYFLKRKGYVLHITDFLVKPILAGLLMAAMLLPVRQLTLLPALSVAAVAGIVYLGALFLLGTFSNEELHLMRDGLGFC